MFSQVFEWQVRVARGEWKSTLPLCNEHTLEHLRRYIADTRSYFLTFRLPTVTESGYYA